MILTVVCTNITQKNNTVFDAVWRTTKSHMNPRDFKCSC